MLSERIELQLQQVLRHVYINPLERCNLRCRICYTRKTSPVLSQSEIISFIDKYQATLPLDSVTFCGGEVFMLKYFPALINEMETRRIFTQCITNGTVDRLQEIHNPNTVNLIVSLDGVQQHHDANRGQGMFDKTLNFLKKAIALGFHVEIFSVIHQGNFDQIDVFETTLTRALGFLPDITYHPRKPPSYLHNHPSANVVGDVQEFGFLSQEQMVQLMRTKQVFPPVNLGCYQIAVASDARVYGCCEGTMPLGTMTDTPSVLAANLRSRLESWENDEHSAQCLGCSQPEFMCGMKMYLKKLHG